MKISNKLLISCYFIIPIVGLFIELNDVTVLLMMWAIAGLVVWTMFRFIKHICDRIIKKLAKIKQQQRTQRKRRPSRRRAMTGSLRKSGNWSRPQRAANSTHAPMWTILKARTR